MPVYPSPLLFICAGTGIAPFRGFWQDMHYEKLNLKIVQPSNKINKNTSNEVNLYFGCRTSKHDELYKNEINQMMQADVIKSCHVAYSREPNKKKVYFNYSFFSFILTKLGFFIFHRPMFSIY